LLGAPFTVSAIIESRSAKEGSWNEMELKTVCLYCSLLQAQLR
jgi:hypothetical protein